MKKWTRFLYQPGLPMGKDGKRVTACDEHINLSRTAATEGMVLLKNEEQVLPLKKGTKVALFGKGSVDYVKGGGGSGDVTVSYIRNFVQGMQIKEQESKVELYAPLNDFYGKEVAAQYEAGIVPGMTSEPLVPEQLIAGAKAFTDTAIITFCRFSGENWDRTIQSSEDGKQTKSEFSGAEEGLIARAAEVFERGDFYLSSAEQTLVETVKENFKKVIVVMNVGGMVDSTWFAKDEAVQSVLMSWQGGMEGGLATADILCGDVTPSGKLVDTFAESLEVYPSSEGFHDSIYYVDYTEDIYVGYRYFSTIPGADQKVNYPFGFGLSYTEFKIEVQEIISDTEKLKVRVLVTNVGSYAGKEVVQLYVSAPQGKLGKPARELKAFVKTALLQPGQSQLVTLEACYAKMASYDDLGKVQKSAYVLEQGAYQFFIGNNVRDAKPIDYVYSLETDQIVEQLSEKCAPNMLKERMLADGSKESLPLDSSKVRISDWDEANTGLRYPDVNAKKGGVWPGKPSGHQLIEVAEGTCSLDEFMKELTLDEMINLLCGQPNTGVANTFGMGNLPDHGVPSVMTADGPAGLRIWPQCGINTTAFPCATLLASTWNEALVEEVGAAAGSEVMENNIGIWLTPAMNIHRSPLCGRNFEYYSEDPMIAGKMGAAMIRGIQSQKVAATPKHFACNNKETCRFESDSRVSERALREIYLKGFEIAVKEADPWTIMSSYNILNGERDSEKKDLLQGILRDEWGFGGIVMTDWWNHAEQYLEINACNDVKMGCGYPERVKKAYNEGKVTQEQIQICARRVLEMILKVG